MKPEQQRAFVKALESTDKYSTGNHKHTAMKTKTKTDLSYAIGYLEAEADSIKENYKMIAAKWCHFSERYAQIQEAIRILKNTQDD